MLWSNFKSVFILHTFDNHRVTLETVDIQSIHITGVCEQVIERVAQLFLSAAGEVTVTQTGLSSFSPLSLLNENKQWVLYPFSNSVVEFNLMKYANLRHLQKKMFLCWSPFFPLYHTLWSTTTGYNLIKLFYCLSTFSFVLWCLCGSTGKANAVPLSRIPPGPVLTIHENISGRGVECGDDGTKIKRPRKEAIVGSGGQRTVAEETE